MRSISVSEAFANAPPRRPAVLCLPGKDGSTDLIATQWFSWLNIKHNPMLSFALELIPGFEKRPGIGDRLYLAFPPMGEVQYYKDGVHISAEGKSTEQKPDLALVTMPGIPVSIPENSEIILCCTLAGSYRDPFKKVRICNCDLEEALKEDNG